MATADRALSRGTQRATRITGELGAEIRRARIEHGLSQRIVARAVRISRSQLSRIERAENRGVSVLVLARLLSVLGMELSARAFPAGQPIRDAAHRAFLDRLREVMGPSFTWTNERPLPGHEDRRAWDAGAAFSALQLAVEAETRLSDLQSLERRIRLKLRDDPTVDGCLLVVADTRHNRTVLRANSEAFSGFERTVPIELARIAAGGNRLVFL